MSSTCGCTIPAAAGVRGERAQRYLRLHAAGHVQEDTALPERAVQGREGVGAGRYGLGHEVRLDQLGVPVHGAVEVAENDALRGEVGLQGLPQRRPVLVHQYPAYRGFRHGEVRRQPGRQLFPPCDRLGRRQRRRVLAEVQPPQIGTPPRLVGTGRHGQFPAQLPGGEALVPHPRRFVPRGTERLDSGGAQFTRIRLNGHVLLPSADRPFHLQLDQAIHLHRVFHRQFLHQRFDETVDDHG